MDPIVLLHGNSGSSKAMRHFEELLQGKSLIYSFDLPLHGENMDYSGELTIQKCADLIEQELNDRNIRAISIIGYSDGANIALELLNRGTVKITKAVLISPNTDVKGIMWGWRLLFYAIKAVVYPFQFIEVFRIIHERMRMMVEYRFVPIKQKIDASIGLFYGERDIVTREDAEKLSRILGTRPIVVASKNHFSVLYSSKLAEGIQRLFCV